MTIVAPSVIGSPGGAGPMTGRGAGPTAAGADWLPRHPLTAIATIAHSMTADHSLTFKASHKCPRADRVSNPQHAHDRRGHGRSSHPGKGHDLGTYADDLDTLQNSAEDLKKIYVPTLIPHGDDDQVAPITALARRSPAPLDAYAAEALRRRCDERAAWSRRRSVGGTARASGPQGRDVHGSERNGGAGKAATELSFPIQIWRIGPFRMGRVSEIEPQARAERPRWDIVGAAEHREIVVETDAVREVERVDLHPDAHR